MCVYAFASIYLKLHFIFLSPIKKQTNYKTTTTTKPPKAERQSSSYRFNY